MPNKSLERTVNHRGRTVRAFAVGARAGAKARSWPAVQRNRQTATMNSFVKFAFVASVALTTCANAATPDIGGIWSSTSRTRGGLGSQWTFAEDGRATYTFGAIVDFLYTATDTQIVMSFLKPSGEPAGDKATNNFTLAGDVLTINPSDAERRQIMRRVGAAREKSSVVGEWTYQHYAEGPAFMRYSSSGGGQLVVPMKTIEGSYRFEDGRLTIMLPSEKTSLTGILREDRSLSVRDAQGRETLLKLFRY